MFLPDESHCQQIVKKSPKHKKEQLIIIFYLLNYLYVATMKSMNFLVVLLMLFLVINAISTDEDAPNAEDLEVPDLK